MEYKITRSSNGTSITTGDSVLPTNLLKVLIAFATSFGIIAVPVLAANFTPIGDVLEDAVSQNIGLAIFLFIAYIVFFFVAMTWISEWSAIYTPEKGTVPVESEILLQRINSLTQKMPVTVEYPKDNVIVYRWNYANEKFIHFFGAGRIIKTYVLTLKLNPKSKEVYSTESMTEVNLGVQGSGKAFFNFHFFKGISLLNFDFGKGYGFTVKNGELVFDEMYSYKFNDAELKAPIIKTITLSGWKFSPKVFLLT